MNDASSFGEDHASEADSQADPIDLVMMQLALQEARDAANAGEVPVGAVVYQGDRILAKAGNRREIDADPTAHAEILALRQAAKMLGSWRLDDCTLAVTLEPCPMCAGAMVNARLPRLVYGATDPKMGCVDTLHHLCTDARFNHRIEIVRGIGAEESAEILRQFFRLRREANKPAKPRPII